MTGGETVQCGPATKVRVLPALHSCLFAHSEADTSVPCLGDLDVSAQERAATVSSLFHAMDSGTRSCRSGAHRHERRVLPP